MAVRFPVRRLLLSSHTVPLGSRTKGVSPDHILQTGFSFWSSKTLLSAVELNVFTELAKAPTDLATLQTKLKLHPRAARDFLDALVALGFLARIGGVYQNTPETDMYLDKAKSSYVGGAMVMASKRLFPAWSKLTPALLTGEQQNEAKGSDLFEKLYSDPVALREFLSAMTGISHGANLMIAQTFAWSKFKSCADVGTAQGDLITQIALANPHLQCTGFDLPGVQPVFSEYVSANGVADRVKFQAGSFFTEELPKVDVILFGHILHDWNLEVKEMLLAKAYTALPEGGAVVVYDAIIDDDRSKNAFGLLMSLNMLIETPDGFDFTGADCIGWMQKAGFKECFVQHLVGPDSMVIGFK